MHHANYTPHNLCHAMGVGTFEPVLAEGELAALRLLVMPSFHPEVCLTMRGDSNGARLVAVAARSQIWHQPGGSPGPSPTHVAVAKIDAATFAALQLQAEAALRPAATSSKVIIDGVRVHAVRRTRDETIAFDSALSQHAAFDEFVKRILSLAWTTLDDPRLRNAIADILSRNLPRFDVPPDKPAVTTMVLGPAEETAPVLAALKQLHRR